MLRWSGDQYIQEAERTVGQRVQAAGYFLQTEVRTLISKPGTAVAASAFIGTGVIGEKGKKYRKGRRIYGATRSKPGEPPLKQYGTLRQSIAQDFDQSKLTSRVGTAAKVGRWLELGTKNMKPRPFLRRSLADNKQKIADMITAGIR